MCFSLEKIIILGNITSSIKMEYTATSPNLYSHDLDRNLPQHHNYNLGFWNHGNSESWDIYLNTILSEKLFTLKTDSEIASIGTAKRRGSFQMRSFGDILYLLPIIDTTLENKKSLSWDLKKSLHLPTGILSIKNTTGKGLAFHNIQNNIKVKFRSGGERCKPEGRDKSQTLKKLLQEE